MLRSRIGQSRGDPRAAAYPLAMEEMQRDEGDVVLAALRRTRQVRRFTHEPVDEADLRAILNAARWTGSSMNRQPWSFILVRDRAEMQRLAELAPNAAHVAGAAVVIAIQMPGEKPEWDAFDEGRLAERILVAANAIGLGAAIGWATPKYRPGVGEFLGLTEPAFVRTMVSIGHRAPEATKPKSAPGAARKPLHELIRERA